VSKNFAHPGKWKSRFIHIFGNDLRNAAPAKKRLETYSSQVFLFQGSAVGWGSPKSTTLSKHEAADTMRKSE
jgi:hypothetical protein